MVRCQNCKKKIKKMQLENVFQITLGNFNKGIFNGNKTLYYHKDELLSPNSLLMK